MPASRKKRSRQEGRAGQTPVVRVHIWLDGDEGVAFGMGRLMLLDAIEQSGSLRSAAELLGMSYRAAWGKLKSTEQALGAPLLEKTGGNRAGYTLTTYGKELRESFRQWFDEVEKLAQQRAGELFPFEVAGFAQRNPPAASEQTDPEQQEDAAAAGGKKGAG